MKIRSQKDFWAGCMFVVAGLGFAWGATNYSMGSSARPGPGYFPVGLGLLLALLGAILLFEAMTVETRARDGEPIGPFSWRPLLLIVASVVVFGLALPRLGMVVALPLLILISSLAGDEFHLGEVAISSVILTLGSWLVFIKGLGLTIPLWPRFIVG